MNLKKLVDNQYYPVYNILSNPATTEIHMTIIDNIHNALIKFEFNSGKSPTNVYLGHNEINELKGLQLPFINTKSRPTIVGMSIYEVDDANHLMVS